MISGASSNLLKKQSYRCQKVVDLCFLCVIDLLGKVICEKVNLSGWRSFGRF